MNYEQATKFLDDLPPQEFWSQKDKRLYRNIFSRFAIKNNKEYLLLIDLYQSHPDSPGHLPPYKKTEFLLRYLDKELSKLPVQEWAEVLSFGVYGNPRGLQKLEKMAAIKHLLKVNSLL